jgi:hypothetical protein
MTVQGLFAKKAKEWYSDATYGIAEAIRHIENNKERDATGVLMEVAMRVAIIINDRRLRCQECLGGGHTSPECPNKVCGYCNREKHVARDCPEIQRMKEKLNIKSYPAGYEDRPGLCKMCDGDHRMIDCPQLEDLREVFRNKYVREREVNNVREQNRERRARSVSRNNGIHVGEPIAGNSRACYGCGRLGHYKRECPSRNVDQSGWR